MFVNIGICKTLLKVTIIVNRWHYDFKYIHIYVCSNTFKLNNNYNLNEYIY